MIKTSSIRLLSEAIDSSLAGGILLLLALAGLSRKCKMTQLKNCRPVEAGHLENPAPVGRCLAKRVAR
jgi:hypothetical protein